MMIELFKKLRRALRRWEDPRYRTQPLALPRAWHGSGRGGLTAAQLARFNVREMGHDPAVISQQPNHRMLHLMTAHFRASDSKR